MNGRGVRTTTSNRRSEATQAASERPDDVVITGAGMVTSLGLDRETTWRGVVDGRCGVGRLTAVESKLDPDKGGGEVHNVENADDATSDPREVRLLRRAIQEALQHAGVGERLPYEPKRCAVLLGTTLHGMRNAGAFLRSGDFSSLRSFTAGATLAAATSDLDLAGLTATTCSACSSGLAGISLGHTLLQTGEADLVIAGGYDPISEYSYAGFNSMRLVSSTTLRPFAKTRDGMKLAEGYAIVVMERATEANRRGANALVRIAGYGESCDAHHLSKPHPEGAGAAAAMDQALAMADLQPNDIDMLVAHATATHDNDKSEHAAMAQVFGDGLRDIPVVGFKSHLGHSLGAAGAADMILAALAIRDGVVPACANSDLTDTEYDDIKFEATSRKKTTLRHVLSTSLGFGGANVCMIVAAPSESTNWGIPAMPRPQNDVRSARDAVITGVGMVIPGAIGTQAFARAVSEHRNPAQTPRIDDIPQEQYQHLLNARRTRRMNVYSKLCLAATADAYRDAGIEDAAGFGEHCCAVLATTFGAAQYLEKYYRQIVEEGIDAANPLLFAEGVPNVGGAHLSTTFSLKGFCQTLIGTHTAGLDALHLATARIHAGVWDRAIVCASDEHADIVCRAHEVLCPGGEFIHAGGAVTFILESRDSAERRGAAIHGTVIATAGGSCAGRPAREKTQCVADVVSRLGTLDALATCTSRDQASRIEKLGIRAAYQDADRQASPPTGEADLDLPELFSAGPLASLAVFLFNGKNSQAPQPAEQGSETRQEGIRKGLERRVGVICTDDNGSTSGAAIELA